jgi:hypothetical protein
MKKTLKVLSTVILLALLKQASDPLELCKDSIVSNLAFLLIGCDVLIQ